MAKVPGTKMAFAGIRNDKEIADLWGYLEAIQGRRQQEISEITAVSARPRALGARNFFAASRVIAGDRALPCATQNHRMARFRDMMALFAMNWIAAEGISSFRGGAANGAAFQHSQFCVRTAC